MRRSLATATCLSQFLFAVLPGSLTLRPLKIGRASQKACLPTSPSGKLLNFRSVRNCFQEWFLTSWAMFWICNIAIVVWFLAGQESLTREKSSCCRGFTARMQWMMCTFLQFCWQKTCVFQSSSCSFCRVLLSAMGTLVVSDSANSQCPIFKLSGMTNIELEQYAVSTFMSWFENGWVSVAIVGATKPPWPLYDMILIGLILEGPSFHFHDGREG